MRRYLILSLFFFNATGVFAASYIVNGSFEHDGLIGDIKTVPPYGWDVNISLPSRFGGNVGNWHTHGNYSLRLYTSSYQNFTAGENAIVSQQVDLTDANQLIFDINLCGYRMGSVPWDGNKVTAFIGIDSNNVWESNISDNGVYYDINVPIGDYSGIHTLSLGIRVGVSQYISPSYGALWDFVKFDAFCGGFGHFDSDLNRDCYINFADFGILANSWLKDNLLPQDDYLDLERDGKVDLFDLAVLVDEWLLCSDWQNGDCVEIPLDLAADINFDGIVNFVDYSILIKNWGTPSDKKADVDGSKIVDYNDLAIMNAQWLQKSWLYNK